MPVSVCPALNKPVTTRVYTLPRVVRPLTADCRGLSALSQQTAEGCPPSHSRLPRVVRPLTADYRGLSALSQQTTEGCPPSHSRLPMVVRPLTADYRGFSALSQQTAEGCPPSHSRLPRVVRPLTADCRGLSALSQQTAEGCPPSHSTLRVVAVTEVLPGLLQGRTQPTKGELGTTRAAQQPRNRQAATRQTGQVRSVGRSGQPVLQLCRGRFSRL